MERHARSLRLTELRLAFYITKTCHIFFSSDEGHIFFRNSLPFQKGAIYLLVISHTGD